MIGAIMGVLVLVWAQGSHTPWRDIGYVRPRSWIRSVAIASVVGVVFKLVMKAVVMPVFARDVLNVGPSGMGALMSAIGVGSMIGPAPVGRDRGH